MDKKQILACKIRILLIEIEEAKKLVDDWSVDYLNNYKKHIENIMRRLQDSELPASGGGLIGALRAISEYDNLACIKKLYDAASDVESFYSRECKEWD